ncbi:MAG: hypothetical protein P1V35_06325 [Planctomycetota bacterium]|nr:hypothetical protein [Planctomycetota bacterium]
MSTGLPETQCELLALQVEQRTTVILSMTESWSASQAMVELHPGGPTALNTFRHLTEVSRTTLEALDLVLPFHGTGESWPEWRSRFESVSGDLVDQLRKLPPGSLENTPAIEILPDFKESLGTRHAFLLGHIFHLAYHAGQLGSIAAVLDRKLPKRS